MIKRFLKAGIIEDTKFKEGEIGTPQGSILSPVLANIYMYYSQILWFEKIKTKARGYVEIINYADDMVLCFQHKDEAILIYKAMKERLKQGELEFAEDKTRLIEFGKFANINAKKQGKNKAGTFDFLGFTHYCSTSNKTGRLRVKRKTSKKKFKQKVKEYKMWLIENRHKPIKYIMEKTKLTGHFNYYGITDNSLMIGKYDYNVRRLLFKWLNRRSQRKSYSSQGFDMMINIFNFPKPRIIVLKKLC